MGRSARRISHGDFVAVARGECEKKKHRTFTFCIEVSGKLFITNHVSDGDGDMGSGRSKEWLLKVA